MPNSEQNRTAKSTPEEQATDSIDSSVAGNDETMLEQSIESSGTSSASNSGVKVTLEIGSTFDRYRIEKLLGKGAMGAVYLATDPQLDRQIALKIPTLSSSTDFIKRFHREARAAAGLRHANICQVYDVGEQDGQHYISMAYIEGESLADVIASGRQLKEREIAGIIRRIARALEVAHEQGIVHRDLKPANIMIDARKEPIVMDFGLAKQTEDRESRITREGTLVGSPAYMSPEQVSGAADLGPSTDIYSLGVILFEMLSGRTPFEGTLVSVIGQIVHSDMPNIQELRPGTSDAMKAICQKAMAKSIEERFQSMKEFAAELTAFMKGKSTLVEQTRPSITKPEPATEEFPAGYEEDWDDDDWDEDRSTRSSSSTRRRKSQSKGKKSGKRKKKSKAPVWIAASVAGVLLIGGAVFAVQKLSGDDDTVGDNASKDNNGGQPVDGPNGQFAANGNPGQPQERPGKGPRDGQHRPNKGTRPGPPNDQDGQARQPLFERFDNNNDGRLDHVEIPPAVIRRWDLDGDDALNGLEVAAIPRERADELQQMIRERSVGENGPFNPNQNQPPNINPNLRPGEQGNPDPNNPDGRPRPGDGQGNGGFERPPKNYEDFVARFDANKDDKVATEEAGGPAKRLDRNQDGVITREEFDQARKLFKPGGGRRPQIQE